MKRMRFAAYISGSVASLLIIAALILLGAGRALAAPPSGVSAPRGQASPPIHTPVLFPSLPKWRATHHDRKTAPQGSGDLVYGGGPVLRNPTAYVVFWGSYWDNGSGGLTPDAQIIVNYFNDVGGTSFENILTQYSDTSGPIANTLQFAASWNDTATPPTDTACNGNPTIEDWDISAEITHAISAQGWPTDLTNAIYFVYTPPTYSVKVGSDCSNDIFCGYHTIATSGLVYAVLPYPDQNDCPALQSPNGNLGGDSLASTTSHEQFEATTDPHPFSGWLDGGGYEVADKCGWNFDYGTTTLNHGGVFYIQTEYSNSSHTCVNSYGCASSQPHIQLSPVSVSVSAQAGTDAASQQVTLQNSASGTLDWSAASLPSWVSVSPASGSLAAGATQTLTLTFATVSYQPQTLTTALDISGNADNSPVSLPISVTLVGGTLSGQVMLGPIMSACESGVPCWMPLAQRDVDIYTATGALVTTVTTDQNGKFAIALIPGDYVVDVVMGPGLPGRRQLTPGAASVVYQQTTTMTIIVDTGLR
jgi:hypothetical protein